MSVLFYDSTPKRNVKEIEEMRRRIKQHYDQVGHELFQKEQAYIEKTVLAAIQNTKTVREKYKYHRGYPSFDTGTAYTNVTYLMKKNKGFLKSPKKMAQVTIDYGLYPETLQIHFDLAKEKFYQEVRVIAEKIQRLMVDRFILIQILCHHREDKDDGYHGPDGALTINGQLWRNDEWFWQSKPELYGRIDDYLAGYEAPLTVASFADDKKGEQ